MHTLARHAVPLRRDRIETRKPCTVLHVFRCPVGGLFRHVLDLAHGQVARGMRVGILCDAGQYSEGVERQLADLPKHAGIAVHRVPISRTPDLNDCVALPAAHRITKDIRPDIIHGHGAKGGILARCLARPGGPLAVYSPHGGSLHYSKTSLAGFTFLSIERALRSLTAGLIFESTASMSTYASKVGLSGGHFRVVYNGLHTSEFALDGGGPPMAECHYDFVFVGELRRLKGVDVLLQGFARLCDDRPTLRLAIAGDGTEGEYFRELAAQLGIAERVAWLGAVCPASCAFRLGRCLVVPSRAEGLPYIVLEAAAACQPLITTKVGGIPEIFGPTHAKALLPPGDVDALSAAMAAFLDDPQPLLLQRDNLYRRVFGIFQVERMIERVVGFYDMLIEDAGLETSTCPVAALPLINETTPRSIPDI